MTGMNETLDEGLAVILGNCVWGWRQGLLPWDKFHGLALSTQQWTIELLKEISCDFSIKWATESFATKALLSGVGYLNICAYFYERFH